MIKLHLLVLLLFTFCYGISAQDIEQIFQEANRKLKNQDYIAAKEGYEKIIALNPKHAKSHHNLGIIYYALQEYEQAKDAYSKAISIDSSEAAPYISRGALYYALRDLRLAEQDLNKAISLNPNALGSHFYRGLLYKAQGKTAEACEDWQEALELGHPQARVLIEKYCEASLANSESKQNTSAKDWYKSGKKNLERLDYRTAVEHFGKAIELDPDYAEAYYSRGVAKYGKQDATGACEDFRKAKDLGYRAAKAMLRDICGD